jgi:predicted house-cleaning NTP pyrophosphatase (Maf/HAM1 superfamily)
MLRRLRGRTHQVYTALAVVRMADNLLNREVCITDISMRDYSDGEILAYVESGDPLDKAGAYAIQHPGFSPVKDIQGCYTNVVGLPVCRLARFLAAFGLYPVHYSSFACLYIDTGGVCSFSPLALNGDASGVQ